MQSRSRTTSSPALRSTRGSRASPCCCPRSSCLSAAQPTDGFPETTCAAVAQLRQSPSCPALCACPCRPWSATQRDLIHEHVSCAGHPWTVRLKQRPAICKHRACRGVPLFQTQTLACLAHMARSSSKSHSAAFTKTMDNEEHLRFVNFEEASSSRSMDCRGHEADADVQGRQQ